MCITQLLWCKFRKLLKIYLKTRRKVQLPLLTRPCGSRSRPKVISSPSPPLLFPPLPQPAGASFSFSPSRPCCSPVPTTPPACRRAARRRAVGADPVVAWFRQRQAWLPPPRVATPSDRQRLPFSVRGGGGSNLLRRGAQWIMQRCSHPVPTCQGRQALG
jgi:hypothetical protein